ncbi:unnamed protein product [Lactuca virosa]|uniref:Uncharacterized protein n=1 Tax=Lactuca virosa TaxID=75947 RepID=A0AAU9LVW2_9ASTR|nr:unnamed protein product [Lactuca virosa]
MHPLLSQSRELGDGESGGADQISVVNQEEVKMCVGLRVRWVMVVRWCVMWVALEVMFRLMNKGEEGEDGLLEGVMTRWL